MKTLAAVLAVAALASAGCYRTRFDLSPPTPEMPSLTYPNKFHFSVLNIIEISRPVDLQSACMGAPPTAIEEEVGILGAIVNAVFSYWLPIFYVHNARVLCPATPAYGPVAPPAYGPPPPGGAPMAPPPAQ
jgi:hypothetical protein